jgi:catechol 2,3-dioxygenase-like lactoylglutathione lyase family enzyme
MNLGAFSVSLAVKDIKKSKEFYQKLGFNIIGGDETQNWLILRNDNHCLGLFQGMFESNILTFNPGWDQQGKNIQEFTDIRDILKQIKSQGIEVEHESMPGNNGPANFALVDPDGNSILFDQHV